MDKKILVITPVPLFPEFGGNRQRIAAVCRELMNQGYTVDMFNCGFLPFNEAHVDFLNGELLYYDTPDGRVQGGGIPRLREVLNGVQAKLIYLKRKLTENPDSFTYNQSLHRYRNVAKNEHLRNQIKEREYHAVLVNYAVYSHYFDLFPNSVIKIIDTHDRLTDRYKIFIENGEKPVQWRSLSKKDERKALLRADVIWGITSDEKEYFKSLVDDETTKVITVPHLVSYNSIPCVEDSASKNILMVSGSSKINIHGLNWFISEVWPDVLEKNNTAQLLISGSICDKKSELNEAENIIYTGRYDAPEEVYSLSTLCINPMRFGTGLKIKTLEALSYGKKVLATSEGAAGLSRFEGKGLICSDEPKEWKNHIINHLADPVMNPQEIEELENTLSEMNHQTINEIKNSL